MKTTKNIQQSVDATQSSKKNEFSNKASIQLSAHNGKTTSSILRTSASPDTAGKFDQGLKATPGRSISYPTLYKCSRESFVPCGSPPNEPSSHLTTIVADRNESSKQGKWGNNKGKIHPLATRAKDTISPRRSADLTSIKPRSKSCSQIQRNQLLDVTYSFKGGGEKYKYLQNQISFLNSLAFNGKCIASLMVRLIDVIRIIKRRIFQS